MVTPDLCQQTVGVHQCDDSDSTRPPCPQTNFRSIYRNCANGSSRRPLPWAKYMFPAVKAFDCAAGGRPGMRLRGQEAEGSFEGGCESSGWC